MSQATQVAEPVAPSVARLGSRTLRTPGLYASASWAAAAIVTKFLPNVVPWGSDDLFAILVGIGAVGSGCTAVASPPFLHYGRLRDTPDHYGPWFIAIGVVAHAAGNSATAKTGWLPAVLSPPRSPPLFM